MAVPPGYSRATQITDRRVFNWSERMQEKSAADRKNPFSVNFSLGKRSSSRLNTGEDAGASFNFGAVARAEAAGADPAPPGGQGKSRTPMLRT